jgi:hypothetical protein
MNGRFRLPCLAEESIALLSIGKCPGSFPRFASHSLQPLLERHAVLSSIAFDRRDAS